MSHLPLLFAVCKRFNGISLRRAIHTDAVLLVNRRGRPRSFDYEPGIRHRAQDFQDGEEIDEEMIDGEVDIMNVDTAYDMNKREKVREKYKIQNVITAKKFFKPRPDPLTLTCNERQYIRFLHKKDPVQWDIHTLSQSFPASPQTIKKIINQKWKISPERAKTLDLKVQANWALLEEGKLDADPKLLEHLKKFVNRREVLLEQLKNSDHYLPEVENKPVWNCGEFKSILERYEKRVKRLVGTQEKEKMLKDGVSEGEGQEKAEGISDILHKKIKEEVSRKKLENKDSFLFGNVTEFYSKHTTLEEMEEELLKRAMLQKKLKFVEQSILENILNGRSHNEKEMSYLKEQFDQSNTPQESEKNEGQNVKEVKSLADIQLDRIERKIINRRKKKIEMKKREEALQSFPAAESPDNGTSNKTRIDKADSSVVQEGSEIRAKQADFQNKFNTSEERMGEQQMLGRNEAYDHPNDRTRLRNKAIDKALSSMVQEGAEMRTKQFDFRNKFRASEERMKEEQMLATHEPFVYPDDRTKFTTETGAAKALEDIQNPPKYEEPPKVEEEISQKKPEIVDPEKLKRAKEYYDKEVKDIENTPFWNKHRSSEEKALAETQKAVLHEESRISTPGENRNPGFYLSETRYPERINIPHSKRKPGGIYKVNDCYYDDDGEFLYRVPGVTK